MAKATMMMTTVLVAFFLFSRPLLLLFLSLLGPGPCVAAEPRHSRSSMFMYSHRMARSGTASDVAKNMPCGVVCIEDRSSSITMILQNDKLGTSD